MLAPGELLNQVAEIHLPHQEAPAARRKKSARPLQSAIDKIRSVLSREISNDPMRFLKLSLEMAGKSEKHHMDLALGEKRVFAAMKALTWRGESQRALQTQLDATAWVVCDVKRKDPNLEIAVLAPLSIAPAQRNLMRSARRVFKDLNAEVLSEKNVSAWAKKQSAKFAA
jgi:hypothetical protein